MILMLAVLLTLAVACAFLAYCALVCGVWEDARRQAGRQ